LKISEITFVWQDTNLKRQTSNIKHQTLPLHIRMSGTGEKKYFNVSVLKRVFEFVRPYRWRFIVSVILAIVLSFFTPVRPHFIQLTVDKATWKISSYTMGHPNIISAYTIKRRMAVCDRRYHIPGGIYFYRDGCKILFQLHNGVARTKRSARYENRGV
jgi:hypothetical protein